MHRSWRSETATSAAYFPQLPSDPLQMLFGKLVIFFQCISVVSSQSCFRCLSRVGHSAMHHPGGLGFAAHCALSELMTISPRRLIFGTIPRLPRCRRHISPTCSFWKVPYSSLDVPVYWTYDDSDLWRFWRFSIHSAILFRVWTPRYPRLSMRVIPICSSFGCSGCWYKRLPRFLNCLRFVRMDRCKWDTCTARNIGPVLLRPVCLCMFQSMTLTCGANVGVEGSILHDSEPQPRMWHPHRECHCWGCWEERTSRGWNIQRIGASWN